MLWVLSAIAAELPLESLTFDVRVAGPLAEVRIHQRFYNPNPVAVDAIYRAPIHGEGALDQLVLRLSDNTIEGRVVEKVAAQEAFNQAAASGQTAALTSFERFDVMTQRVSNIQPGETLDVELSVVQPLRRIGELYELELPLLDAPRLVPEGEEPSMEMGDVTATIEVSVDAGVEIQRLDSPSHPVFARPDGQGWQVSATDLPLDDNFRLQWSVASEMPEVGALVDGEHLLLVLEPQAALHAPIESRQPREVVFLLDGVAADQNAVKHVATVLWSLGPQDRFRVLPFGGSLVGEATVPTPEAVEAAIQRVQGTYSQEGSEVGQAVAAALDAPMGDLQRYVVVVSDGLTREEGVFEILLSYEGRAQVHTLGVGGAANRWVLDEIARLGGGTSTMARDQDPELFAARVGRPVLSGVTIDWAGWNLHGVSPQRIPDVHLDQPQHVLAQVIEGGGPITVRGFIAGGPFEAKVTPRTIPHGRGMASTWARTRIGELGNIQIRTGADARVEGLPLALDYGVVSPWTSLIAIDPRKRKTSVKKATHREEEKEKRSAEEERRADFRVEDAMESIEVVNEKAVDTESTSRSQVVTKDFLTRVPSGRSYQTATQMAAGVQVGSGGNPNIGGAAANENTYLIDGAAISEPVSGTFSTAHNDVKQPVLADETAQFPVGNNNLAVGIGATYRHGLARSRRVRGLTLGGEVSGPIVRDKFWFLAGIDHLESLDIGVEEAVDRRAIQPSVLANFAFQPNSTHRFTLGALASSTTRSDLDVSPRREALLPSSEVLVNAVKAEGSWSWFQSPRSSLVLRAEGQVDDQQRLVGEGPIGWSGAEDLLPAVAELHDRQRRARVQLRQVSEFGLGRVEHVFHITATGQRVGWRSALDLPDLLEMGPLSVLPGAVIQSGDAVDLQGRDLAGSVEIGDVAERGPFKLDVAVRLDGAEQLAQGIGRLGAVGVGGHASLAADPLGDDRSRFLVGVARTPAGDQLGVRHLATMSALGGRVLGAEGGIHRPAGLIENRRSLPAADVLVGSAQIEIVEDFSVLGEVELGFARRPYVIDRGLDNTLTTHDEARRTDLLVHAGLRKILSRRWRLLLDYQFQQAYGTLQAPGEPTFRLVPGGIVAGRLPVGDEHTLQGSFHWTLPVDPWTMNLRTAVDVGSGAWVERLSASGTPLNPYATRTLPRGPFASLPAWWAASVFIDQQIPLRRGAVTLSFGVDNIGPKVATQLSPWRLANDGESETLARRGPTVLQFGLGWEL